MQLVNIKAQGEKMANEKIKELVLTVPAFWTEQERKAIVDAAELAGMKVSILIHDGLAGISSYIHILTFSRNRLLQYKDIHRGSTIPSHLRHGCRLNDCNTRLLCLPFHQRRQSRQDSDRHHDPRGRFRQNPRRRPLQHSSSNASRGELPH